MITNENKTYDATALATDSITLTTQRRGSPTKLEFNIPIEIGARFSLNELNYKAVGKMTNVPIKCNVKPLNGANRGINGTNRKVFQMGCRRF